LSIKNYRFGDISGLMLLHEVIVFPKLVQVLVDFIALRNVLDGRSSGFK
jgi:hypothetical protein